MKETKRTLVTVMNHKGFNKNYATLGSVRLSVTDGDTFREHLIESTEDWVETDSNGCISTLEVFKEPRPYTSHFVVRNQKAEDLSNHDLFCIIRENIVDERIKPLFEEFTDRYTEIQKKLYSVKSKYSNCYTEADLWDAMQFASLDVTGRKVRPAYLDVLVEDFLKERDKSAL
jgi:hypothetical protein